MFQIMLLYALWSMAFPIGKWLLQFSSPVMLTALRMLFAGILLTGYITFFKRRDLRLNRQQWLSIGVLAVFSIYLTNVLEFYSLQYLSASKTCFIYSLSPFLAAFFSFLHFGETMTRQKWLGMGVGLCGFIPMMIKEGTSGSLFSFFNFSVPELAVAMAALLSVYGWVILRLVVKDEDMSPLTANGLSMILGGLLALGHAYVFNTNSFHTVGNHAYSLSTGIIALTVISNLICYNLYGYLLKRYTATLMSFCGLLSPIFASINSWILIGEVPSMTVLLSTGIVAIGLWMVYRSELKQGYIQDSTVATKSQ